MLLGSDLAGRWSECPTTLISWLDGKADITPTDPDAWAMQLGHALATVDAMRGDRVAVCRACSTAAVALKSALDGPLATRIRSDWSQITASPEVLTHYDYWSGNVVWREEVLTGIVDWSGGARGPRGFDVGWCRLDLYLLFDERVADVFLAAYEDATGYPVADMELWDGWAVARSHDIVETWTANYRPLGRADLDEDELRRRHSQWTSRSRSKGDSRQLGERDPSDSAAPHSGTQTSQRFSAGERLHFRIHEDPAAAPAHRPTPDCRHRPPALSDDRHRSSSVPKSRSGLRGAAGAGRRGAATPQVPRLAGLLDTRRSFEPGSPCRRGWSTPARGVARPRSPSSDPSR